MVFISQGKIYWGWKRKEVETGIHQGNWEGESGFCIVKQSGRAVPAGLCFCFLLVGDGSFWCLVPG